MPPQIPNSFKEPKDLTELFTFYHDYVKVLYSYVQTQNALPQEVLFEINAAFDHLSRIWIFNEREDAALRKCYGHLKRSCLDIFKISVREAKSQYDEIKKIDTSVIDNGDFDKNLLKLFSDIRKGATEARRLEGDANNDTNASIKAFDEWQPVFVNCLRLESEFYHHPRIDWAKRKWWVKYWKSTLIASFFAMLSAAIGREYGHEIIVYITNLISKCC